MGLKSNNYFHKLMERKSPNHIFKYNNFKYSYYKIGRYLAAIFVEYVLLIPGFMVQIAVCVLWIIKRQS